MRLDHLLSKEHFYATLFEQSNENASETVCVPIRGTADAHGWNTDTLHRMWPALKWLVAVDISAHCWVLREHASVSLGKITTRLDLQSYRGISVPAGAEYGFGFVCCLRTAQWTRASLLVSV